jgi:Domain of unknown function (DUF1707)
MKCAISQCPWRAGAAALRFACIARAREVAVTTGQDEAGRDRLRAGHADREQVIEALKTAFVGGRLTREELDARTGRALAARTYADLAAVTADIPAGQAGQATASAAPPPAAARRRRRPSPPVIVFICLAIAAAMWGGLLFGPGGSDPRYLVTPMIVLAVTGVFTALGVMACAVVKSLDQGSPARQLPAQAGPV